MSLLLFFFSERVAHPEIINKDAFDQAQIRGGSPERGQYWRTLASVVICESLGARDPGDE